MASISFLGCDNKYFKTPIILTELIQLMLVSKVEKNGITLSAQLEEEGNILKRSKELKIIIRKR